MESLNHFSIPIQGLKDGVHPFKFQIDRTFFKLFEESPIEEGKFEVNLLTSDQICWCWILCWKELFVQNVIDV